MQCPEGVKSEFRRENATKQLHSYSGPKKQDLNNVLSMFMTIMVKQTKKLKKKNICKCMEVFNYMFFAAKKKQYL